MDFNMDKPSIDNKVYYNVFRIVSIASYMGSFEHSQ